MLQVSQTKSIESDQFFLQEDAAANPERSLPPLPGVQLPKDSFSQKVIVMYARLHR